MSTNIEKSERKTAKDRKRRRRKEKIALTTDISCIQKMYSIDSICLVCVCVCDVVNGISMRFQSDALFHYYDGVAI